MGDLNERGVEPVDSDGGVPQSREAERLTLRDNAAVNELTVTAVWLWCVAASVALWLLVAWTVGLVV